MKKYLKKAISAVIALALAASMVPATFAADVALTDVPETADYATAVNTLVALGVVNGYEDNTFKPDNNITRAEASKIIVAALNETASADAMKGATKFSDIEAKHEWATGYINKGVSMGYINGMENNQFQPDGNVTFAQVVKMMLCAMGYEDYAVSLADQYGYTGANWYIPYTQLAADAGVTDGVYAGPNEAVTRAQVAQLVYNAVKAPIVKNVGISYTDSGKIVPKIQIQDGVETSVFYRSILTEKFDAYFVEGYVMETSKDSDSLKAGEVKFGIAKSKRYVEEDVQFTDTINDISKIPTSRILQKVYVGDTAAADYKGTYATAIIMLDEYDDWTILDFAPSGKNKVVDFDIKDLDEDKSTASNLYFFVDGAKTSTKYPLNDGVAVYVNGVLVEDVYTTTVDDKGTETTEDDVTTTTKTVDVLNKYVLNAEVGTVQLVDTYKTDGKYDTIFVEKYMSAMVDSVSAKNGKIVFKSDDYGVGSMTLDEEKDDVEFAIYLDGEEITVDSLQEYDVLTISYAVDANETDKNSFKNSKFYEVYVSRTVVNDTLKGRDAEEFAAKFGDTYYEYQSEAKYADIAGAQLGDEYTVYLDAFNRVYKSEMNSSAANWAIVNRFSKSSSDDEYKVSLFTADGTTKAFYLGSKATVKFDGAKQTPATGLTINDVVGAKVQTSWTNGSDNGGGTVKDVANLVVKYRVSSSTGKITEIDFITASPTTVTDETNTKKAYKASSARLGSIYFGAATKTVDATKWTTTDKDLSIADYDAVLVDEMDYEAYAYGDKINGDTIHPFVIIRHGDAKINANSRFAVVTEDAYEDGTDDETGEYVYIINAMNGENDKLIAGDEADLDDLEDLKKGDVIYYTTDNNGYVDEVAVVFSFGSEIPATNDALAAAVFGGADYLPARSADLFSPKFTENWAEGDDDDYIRVVFGPVIKRTDSEVTFAKFDDASLTWAGNDGKISETEGDAVNTDNISGTFVATDIEADENADNGLTSFRVASDVNVYTYDYSEGSKYRFGYSGSSISGIQATNISDKYMIEVGESRYIPWNLTVDSEKPNMANASFALAVVVDGEIVDIFGILAD